MYAGEVKSSLLGKREDMTFCYKKVDLPDMLERNETNTQEKTDSGRAVRFEWKLNLIKGHRDILIF